MTDQELADISGMGIGTIKKYRKMCGVKGSGEWGINGLRKLEGFSQLPYGTLVPVEDGDKEPEVEKELVIVCIYRNPIIVGARLSDKKPSFGDLLRLRKPQSRRVRVGMRVKAKHLENDLWQYTGMVLGQ